MRGSTGPGKQSVPDAGGHERGDTHDAGVDEGVLKGRVAGKQLLLEQSRVADVAEDGDVNAVRGGEVVQVEGLKSHG